MQHAVSTASDIESAVAEAATGKQKKALRCATWWTAKCWTMWRVTVQQNASVWSATSWSVRAVQIILNFSQPQKKCYLQQANTEILSSDPSTRGVCSQHHGQVINSHSRDCKIPILTACYNGLQKSHNYKKLPLWCCTKGSRETAEDGNIYLWASPHAIWSHCQYTDCAAVNVHTDFYESQTDGMSTKQILYELIQASTRNLDYEKIRGWYMGKLVHRNASQA